MIKINNAISSNGNSSISSTSSTNSIGTNIRKMIALDDINKSYTEDQKIEIRQNKYLNNMVEQDHRFIKRRTKPTLGFKSWRGARETIKGIEIVHMIKKRQLKHENQNNKLY